MKSRLPSPRAQARASSISTARDALTEIIDLAGDLRVALIRGEIGYGLLAARDIAQLARQAIGIGSPRGGP